MDQVKKIYREHINSNYVDFLMKQGLDDIIVNAKDDILRDERGKEYIDFISGYGIFNLGHNPAHVIHSLHKELEKNPLWNRPFLNEPLANLAVKLIGLSPNDLDRVFFCSTGAEAVDSAIKLTRLSTRKTEIIAAEGGFHGFTLGALSVSGIPAQTRSFEPLLPGIKHVPFGNIDAIMDSLTDQTAAILLEPIQAESGAITPPVGYLSAVRKLCDTNNILMIVDEVRTGIGRTGHLFAVNHEQVSPDILIIGKSLAAGILPIGAILAKSKLWNRFEMSFAMTASSFAGNRMSCVAALAALDMLGKKRVLEQGHSNASVFWKELKNITKNYSSLISGITGKGMLIGVHFHDPQIVSEVVSRSIRKGLLLAAAFCNRRCILIEPPLVIQENNIHKGIKILTDTLQEMAEG